VLPAAAPRARPAPRAFRPPFFPLALVLLALICASAPAAAEVRLPDGEYYAAVEDLSVKVMGGYVTASRSWFRNRWYFNAAWAPLAFTYDSLDGSVKAIERAGWRYERTPSGVFVFGARNLIRATAGGYQWQDRAGNFIDYDAHGRIQAYGDRNAVTVRFRYEGEHISGVLDPSGNQVLWYERAGAELRAVRDAAGRRVEYRYSGGRLSEVIDVLGQSWRYQYNNAGRLSVVSDPEGRELRIDYGANGRVAKLTAPDGRCSTATRCTP
jgi:YD repeat-containing protein